MSLFLKYVVLWKNEIGKRDVPISVRIGKFGTLSGTVSTISRRQGGSNAASTKNEHACGSGGGGVVFFSM